MCVMPYCEEKCREEEERVIYRVGDVFWAEKSSRAFDSNRALRVVPCSPPRDQQRLDTADLLARTKKGEKRRESAMVVVVGQAVFQSDSG